jgi:hypothetical protein
MLRTLERDGRKNMSAELLSLISWRVWRSAAKVRAHSGLSAVVASKRLGPTPATTYKELRTKRGRDEGASVEADHVELQASVELSKGDIVGTQGTALSSTEGSKPEMHKLAGVEAELCL